MLLRISRTRNTSSMAGVSMRLTSSSHGSATDGLLGHGGLSDFLKFQSAVQSRRFRMSIILVRSFEKH